jgi:hypothetical protein
MRQMDIAAVSLRPDKMPSLKLLCQEPKAVLSGPQNLCQVTAPPAKNEDVATQWILRERGLSTSAVISPEGGPAGAPARRFGRCRIQGRGSVAKMFRQQMGVFAQAI